MTLREIAERCDVSIATVSRVLNNKNNVKNDKKKKIIKLLQENKGNYKYISSKEKGKIISIIIPDIHNPFYGEIIKGITQVAEKENYDILLYDTHDDLNREIKYIKKSINQNVTGILLMSSSKKIHDKSYKELIRNSEIPIILIDKKIPNFPVSGVFLDDVTGIFMLTESLIEKNHKNIAFVTGEKESEVTQKRLSGYKKALIDNGIAFSNESVLYTSYRASDTTFFTIKSLLSDKNRPDAIVSCSGLLTIAIIKTCHELKIKIGKDISLVSFDNLEILDLLGMEITSAYIDLKEMGKSGFNLLLNKIYNNNFPFNQINIIPKIIEKGSERVTKIN